jgi:cell division protein FtsA
MTGMDTRIGYPNEHLAPGTPNDMASPMFATGIGLVIQGVERQIREKVKEGVKEETRPVEKTAAVETPVTETQTSQMPEEEIVENEPIEEELPRKPKTNGFLKRIQDWFEGDEV